MSKKLTEQAIEEAKAMVNDPCVFSTDQVMALLMMLDWIATAIEAESENNK